MIYPVPAVLVTVADGEGNSNIITIAWTGTICTNPPMAYISVRPGALFYHMLRESGEFVINLATESMAYATDYCGVRSGRNVDKWKETGLTPVPAQTVKAPVIAESPVAIECRVTEVKELGSHHMFLAEVTVSAWTSSGSTSAAAWSLQRRNRLCIRMAAIMGFQSFLEHLDGV